MAPWSNAKPPPEHLDMPGESPRSIVGPSMHGWIYRDESGSHWTRVLTLEEMSLRRKKQLRQWCRTQLGPGLAQPVTATQKNLGQEYFVVEYEPGDSATSWIECLQAEGQDLTVALESIVRTVLAVPGWWKAVGAPLFLLPTDVLVLQDGTPFLLPVPPCPNIGLPVLFADSRRACHVAPEYLRSQVGGGSQNLRALDHYSLGVSLMSFLCDIPEQDTTTTLEQGATGSWPRTEPLRQTLPSWLSRVPALRRIQLAVLQLCSTDPADRMKRSLQQVGEYLAKCRERMAPSAAVRETRKYRSTFEAYQLFLECRALRDYDLLLQGGELARECSRPFDAIDYYGEAIELHPERIEAYEQLFLTISSGRENSLVKKYYLQDEYATDLDQRIVRAFKAMDSLSSQLGKKHEFAMGSYYLWRAKQVSARYAHARQWLYSRLFDSKGTFLAWKLGLVLGHCEAMLGCIPLGQATVAECGQALAGARQAIQRYGPRVDPATWKRAERKFVELGAALQLQQAGRLEGQL